MRIILLFIFGIIGLSGVTGQQEQLYTQFMFNKLAINPAYAGNDDLFSITAIHRNQWSGFDGAPETQLLSLNAPVGNRVGLGLNLARNTIGIAERLTIEGVYAYRFPVGPGNLSIGAQVSGRRLTVDYTDPRLFAINGLNEDQAIEMQRMDKNVINFGAGLYFNTDNFYVGASVPRLINADIDFDNDILKSEEVLHVYFMTGFKLKLNPNLVLTPQMLFKAAENSPGDFDFNFSLCFKEIVTTGFTIRTGGSEDIVGESLDFILGIQASKNILFSFAYDYTLSDIKNYENGSLEFLLNYRFTSKKHKTEPTNPRYF
jgi:type IX secretion system PorP/SprF family membrane protein